MFLVVSCRVVSFRFVSFRVVSFRFVSFHVVSLRLMFRFVSCLFVAFDSFCFTSSRFVWPRFVALSCRSNSFNRFHFISFRFVSFHRVSCRIVSCRVDSQALVEEFTPELTAKVGKLDSDPHLWMPVSFALLAFYARVLFVQANAQTQPVLSPETLVFSSVFLLTFVCHRSWLLFRSESPQKDGCRAGD